MLTDQGKATLAAEKLDRAREALEIIRDNKQGESWSAGFAMSALCSLEELDEAGECPWHPGEPVTMLAKLCNDDGVVERDDHGENADYPCTGGAHRFGYHILCTSPAHNTRSSRDA